MRIVCFLVLIVVKSVIKIYLQYVGVVSDPGIQGIAYVIGCFTPQLKSALNIYFLVDRASGVMLRLVVHISHGS